MSFYNRLGTIKLGARDEKAIACRSIFTFVNPCCSYVRQVVDFFSAAKVTNNVLQGFHPNRLSFNI